MAVLTLLMLAVMRFAMTLVQIPGFALSCSGPHESVPRTAAQQSPKQGIRRGLLRTIARASGDGRSPVAWLVYAAGPLIAAALVLYFSYIMGLVLLLVAAAHVTGSVVTFARPGYISPSMWMILHLVAPAACFSLLRDVTMRAGRESLRERSLTAHAVKPGRRWRPENWSNSSRAATVNLRWPAHLVHVLDRRALIVQTTLWKLYRRAPVIAIIGAAIALINVERDLNWNAGAVTSVTPTQIGTSIEGVVLGLLTAAVASEDFLIPSAIRVQLDMLRCVAEEPVEALSFGLVDPIGSHRSTLYDIARRLALRAQRIERRVPTTAANPYAIMLRGAARAINDFISGSDSLGSEIPAELREILTYTVATMAGPRSPMTRFRLAEMVAAFQNTGKPDSDLIVPVTGWISRAGSAIYGAIDRLSSFVKALFVIIMIGVFIALLIRGRVALTGLPIWKP
jgi:hypothetical protein